MSQGITGISTLRRASSSSDTRLSRCLAGRAAYSPSLRHSLGLVTVKQKSVALRVLVCASTLTALWLTLSEREPYGGASMLMGPATGVVVTTGTTSGFYYPSAGHVLTWRSSGAPWPSRPWCSGTTGSESARGGATCRPRNRLSAGSTWSKDQICWLVPKANGSTTESMAPRATPAG